MVSELANTLMRLGRVGVRNEKYLGFPMVSLV